MALTFGQLASGAGAVGTGMRQAEEAERVARQNQLRIEEQNRANQAAKEIQASRAGLQVPTMPDFTGGTGGQQFGIPQAAPVAAPPAPAAPAVVPEVTVGPMGELPPLDMDGGVTQGTPLGLEVPAELTTTPAERAAAAERERRAKVREAANEKTRTEALREQVARQYRSRAGISGSRVTQTPEEYEFANEVMKRRGELTRPELEQLLQTGQLPPKAAPKAGVKEPAAAELTTGAKPSTKVANATRGYDNAKTPYNDLMNQAAQQYGLDPVVFKRLIGTESSFDPNAVSPRGESFGLGIGQIAEVHGLTREQRLDPNISIPKAAEIFAQYLREANGDYTAALMRYKGASSEKGIAAMQEPVAIILNGTNVQGAQEIELVGKNPGQTADRVATAAAAPATSGLMFGPSSVAGGAQNPGVQSALMLRQTLASEYEIYNRNRMFGQADEALAQIAGIDLGLYKAQADLGVYELSTSGDASRAMSVLSQFTGVPTQALARGDGTYDLYTNGRVSQTAVPVDKLADLIRTQVDAGYRQQKAELAASRSGKVFEKDLELRNKVQEELVKAQGNIEKALIDGKFKLLEKQAEAQGGKLTVDTSNGVALFQKDGQVYVIDPRATTEVRGQTVSTPSASRITLPN